MVPVVGQELLTVGDGAAARSYHEVVAESLGEYLGVSVDDLPPGAELETVADRYLAGAGANRQLLYSGLKSIALRGGAPTVPPALTQLAGITDFALFVSTTFDDLLTLGN